MRVLAEHGWENHIFTGGAVNGFESIISSSSKFKGGHVRRALQLARLGGDFDLAILYEPRDVEIYQLSRLLGGQVHAKFLVHHSLEIPTEILRRCGLKSGVHRFLYRGYRGLDRLIIQDEARQKLLYDCFPELRKVECVLVPNSYLLDFEPVAEFVPWFDEIRRAGRRVVTYTGAIERWALSLELFQSIRDMRDVSFVFSGWSYDGFSREAIALCHDAKHIHFDLGVKNRSELNYIVKNSDLGLVFYDSSDPNVAVIGLSSGKLHKFLSYGKPVIVNDVPSIKKFLEDNGFGLASSPQSIPDSIHNILETYESYSERVVNGYSSLIDFRSSYERFIGTIVIR
jgi:glycosyltransferase involved in cell wall biosynthesis